MKKFAAFIALFTMLFTTANAQEMAHYSVNVGDFTSLKVADNINVVYSSNADSAGYVSFIAPNNMVNNIILENNGKGRLTIQVIEDVFKDPRPTLKVYSTTLSEVVNESDSTVDIIHLAATPTFKAVLENNGHINIVELNTATTTLKIVTGKGSITAKGQTAKLDANITGTGRIYALELPAREVNCKLGGTGYLYCTSTGGKLSVKGIGSGKVYYKGNPSEVKVKKLGTIKALPYTGKE